MRLAGKVALITGGGKGIGKATARLFGTEGAAVCVMDLDGRAAEETAAEVRQGGGRAIAVQGNVAVEDDARRAVEECVRTLGGLDVLCNIAGTFRIGTVETLAPDDWDAVMAVNVKGPFLMGKYAVPVMRARGGGSIINIGSTASLVAARNLHVYGTSKAAVLGLTRSMAADYAADGIRVNCICPGATETDLLHDIFRLRDATDAARRAFLEKHPIGRFARAEEIARVALFLAGEESSYMTGSVVAADGGFTAV